MSSIPTSRQPDRLIVPDTLKEQLSAFRGRVWTSKMLESVVLGAAGLLLAFLTVYCIDRFLDTPRTARMAILVASVVVWLAVPWALHRWVWRNRRFEQLARLLRVREPGIGDQLLSVIELSENESEQARSRTLCAAAIEQVADAAKGRDFADAAPPTRLILLSTILAVAAVVSLMLVALFPLAAQNAWSRFSAPWRDTPRYTFTSIDAIPSNIVVPHGETTAFAIRLTEESEWQPASATIQVGTLPEISATLDDGQYAFELPPQVAPVSLTVHVGDCKQTVDIEPKVRPELIGAMANIRLPTYLERTEPIDQDVRSGTLSVVEGSSATIQATASRVLRNAKINDTNVAVDDASFSTSTVDVAGNQNRLSMWWEDHDGLAGRAPFDLTVKSLVDELPSVVSQDLPRQAVVLDTEQINFQALAADDFGVKKIGISWKGLDDRLVESASGEKLIAAGDPSQLSMQVPATFSAASLGIMAQPLEVRLWVEDYMPNRERVYSPPHTLFVLTAEQHAVWITNQMSKWHRASLDVRDKELQLYEANKRLRAMTPEELADQEMRNELKRQASLEARNGRRLAGLARSGEDLLRQASRNPEIGVGHLDRWAEMLQILNDIGTNRMPSVSDLLGKASKQKQLARGGPGKPAGPSAGKSRASAAGTPGKQDDSKLASNAPKMPSISDMESSMQPQEDEGRDEDEPAVKKKGNGSRLTLPKTTLVGPAKKSDPQQQKPEEKEEDAVDQALFEQEDLLAEFEKIADELNTILANLEGSTLVKRLKSASREQDQVAQKIGSRIDAVFGRASRIMEPDDRKMLKELGGVEEESSQKISYIMDDMQSYFERRRMNQFKVVLDEMKTSEVLVALQTLGEEIPSEQGMSIAQAEYWSDSLDRWAEDLVDPACSGQCPGCKNSDALPPSIILEVLKILESEVNLREETRVAEQARPAIDESVHETEASRLSEAQDALQERIEDAITAIEQLPKGSSRFGKEIKLLSSVGSVMQDATTILASNETGSPAIAAETEAIELLLQCKRINPKGGGGGGDSPGGGGTGTTQDSALALLGSGLNQNERREARDVTQATGETGRVLPEEYRGGLDEYYNRLETGL